MRSCVVMHRGPSSLILTAHPRHSQCCASGLRLTYFQLFSNAALHLMAVLHLCLRPLRPPDGLCWRSEQDSRDSAQPPCHRLDPSLDDHPPYCSCDIDLAAMRKSRTLLACPRILRTSHPRLTERAMRPQPPPFISELLTLTQRRSHAPMSRLILSES